MHINKRPKSEALSVLFISAEQDKEHKDALEQHVIEMRQQKEISNWSIEEMIPGRIKEKEIKEKLLEASIVILFISRNFANDKLCTYAQNFVLDNYEEYSFHLIPVYVSPFMYNEKLKSFRILPSRKHPITDTSKWPTPEHAYIKIATQIEALVEYLKYPERALFKDLAINNIRQKNSRLTKILWIIAIVALVPLIISLFFNFCLNNKSKALSSNLSETRTSLLDTNTYFNQEVNRLNDSIAFFKGKDTIYRTKSALITSLTETHEYTYQYPKKNKSINIILRLTLLDHNDLAVDCIWETKEMTDTLSSTPRVEYQMRKLKLFRNAFRNRLLIELNSSFEKENVKEIDKFDVH